MGLSYVSRNCPVHLVIVASIFVSTCYADGVGAEKPTACPTHFASLDITNISTQSPKLAQFLDSRSYSRLIRTQPEGLRTVGQKIVDAPLGRTEIDISGENLRAAFYVTKANGSIDVEISYVSTEQNVTGVVGFIKSAKAMGKRNESLNMIFPRVIAAVADGIDKQIAADPSLKTISISGSTVINLHLTKQLRELGFVPNKPNAFKVLMGMVRREGAYALWIHNIADWTGVLGVVPEQLHLPIKLVKNATLVFSMVKYREMGRNWKIEFQVNREAAGAAVNP